MAVDGRGHDQGPTGRGKTGPNPTDRAKSGTKRSLLTEGNGIPVALAIEGANRNDHKMTQATLDAKVIEAPKPNKRKLQNLCLDKGYDYPAVDELVDEYGYTAHISRRGEDATKKKRHPGGKARRWVVERTHSWLNRFRRLLVRWEKKARNYLGMLHFACAWITYRRAGVSG